MNDDLYVCRNEAGRVIYVGRTSNIVERVRKHRCSTPWWSQVDSVEVLRRRGRFEMATIAKLRPEHNRWGNPDWRHDSKGFVPIMRPLRPIRHKRVGDVVFTDLARKGTAA